MPSLPHRTSSSAWPASTPARWSTYSRNSSRGPSPSRTSWPGAAPRGRDGRARPSTPTSPGSARIAVSGRWPARAPPTTSPIPSAVTSLPMNGAVPSWRPPSPRWPTWSGRTPGDSKSRPEGSPPLYSAGASSAGWRGALPEEVVAPAGGRAVGLLRTRVKTAGADRREGAGRDRGLADVVEAPADGGAVAADGAGVVEAGADCDDGGGRRGGLPVGVGAPAAHGARDPDRARMQAADADRGDGDQPCRQGVHSVGAVAPTGGRVVDLDGARVHPAGTDRVEGPEPGRQGGLPVGVGAPAGGGVVGFDCAGVSAAGADRGDGAEGGRRGALPVGVGAPAGGGVV